MTVLARGVVVLAVAGGAILMIYVVEDPGWDTWANISVLVGYGLTAGFLARGWWILPAPLTYIPAALVFDAQDHCDASVERCEGVPAIFIAGLFLGPALLTLIVGVLLGKAHRHIMRPGDPAA